MWPVQIDEQVCVTCILFGSLKINLAASFWINCRDLMELAGRPAKSIAIVKSGQNKSLNKELCCMLKTSLIAFRGESSAFQGEKIHVFGWVPLVKFAFEAKYHGVASTREHEK